MPSLSAADTLPSAQDNTQSLIDQGLKAPFWSLTLPGSLERQFRQETVGARWRYGLRSGWLALLIFNSFLLVDWLMTRDVFWTSVTVRLGVFTPLGVLTLLLTHYLAPRIGERLVAILMDWVVVLSGWGAALALAAILFVSESPWVPYYHAGFMVVVIYGNLVQQLSFRAAVIFSLGILLIHVVGVQWAPDYPLALRAAMVQLLAGTALLTLIANYMVEKAKRRNYLLMLRENSLVADLSHINQQLHRLSRSDVLTGLSNRRHLHDHLHEVWERARVAQAPVSILMMDVDHFKAYNDRYGHPAGDECLKQVAQALAGHVRRPGDVAARYGGEEFVGVMPGADAVVARQAAERVRQAVQDMGLAHEGSATARVVTVSVGVATAVPGLDCATPESLLSRADKALYEAKRETRNRVCVFGDQAV